MDKLQSWKTWGLVPHTEDEIREKMLTDPDGVCLLFVMEVSHISQDFYKELQILSILNPETNEPFLTKDNYEQMYVPLLHLYKNVKCDGKYDIPDSVCKLIYSGAVIQSKISTLQERLDNTNARIQQLENKKKLMTDPAAIQSIDERLTVLSQNKNEYMHNISLLKGKLTTIEKFQSTGIIPKNGWLKNDLKRILTPRV